MINFNTCKAVVILFSNYGYYAKNDWVRGAWKPWVKGGAFKLQARSDRCVVWDGSMLSVGTIRQQVLPRVILHSMVNPNLGLELDEEHKILVEYEE